MTLLRRSPRTANSGGNGDEGGGGSAGATLSHASTAQMPEWYCARTADGAAAAPPSASAPSAMHHLNTACAARRRLGGSLRRTGLPQASRRRHTCSSAGAHVASMARAVTLSGLLAASSAHAVATLAARPYTSHPAYLRPREAKLKSASAAASAARSLQTGARA